MIPKIIHYCWINKEDPFPEAIRACMYSWKKHLGDYEFRLWDSSTFDIESSQWVKDAFYSKYYAFAADYIRCHALYHHGGIYLDCDVEIIKSLNPLLHFPYILGREQTESGLDTGTMGFEKEHPLMKDMLDYYDGRRFFLGNNKFDTKPIPFIMKEFIDKRYTQKEINSIEEFDFNPEVLSIFRAEFFSPKKWDTKELIESPLTYSIHHFSGSWKKKRNIFSRLDFLRYRFLGLFMKKYRI